jgi:hypothetical protein
MTVDSIKLIPESEVTTRLEKQLFVLICVALLLGSCAMMPGFVSDAQVEFEQGLALFNSGKYQEAIPRFPEETCRRRFRLIARR